jgi:hypothetical protein
MTGGPRQGHDLGDRVRWRREQGSGGMKTLGKRHAATGSSPQLRRVGSYAISMGTGLFVHLRPNVEVRSWVISVGMPFANNSVDLVNVPHGSPSLHQRLTFAILREWTPSAWVYLDWSLVSRELS